MGKRLFILITFLLVAGIFAGWYFFAEESRYFGTSPLKAVPVESPFFVRIRNMGDFTTKNVKSTSWQSLSNFPEVSELYGNFVFIDSLIHQNKEHENFLKHKELIVIPGDSSMLFLLEITSITEKNGINLFIRNYFQSKSINPEELDFGKAKVQYYEWTKEGIKKCLAVTFYRGMLIVSNDRSFLGKAIDQIDHPSVLEDEGFLRLNKNATENADLNIYFNHKTFPDYLFRFFKDSLNIGIFQPNYAKWTEIDVIQKENQLLINGYTIPDTVQACYLDVFKRQKPLTGALVQIMPSNTTFFVDQNVSQTNQYFEDFNRFLQKKGNSELYKHKLSALSKELNIDISQYIKDAWTGEVAVVFTNMNLEDPADNRFLLMKVKSGTNDVLINSLKKWSANNKSELKDLESTEAQRNNIWQIPCADFGSLLGEFYFGTVKTNWLTAGDGFILMGATPGSLIRYLSLLQRHELLQENPSYLRFTTGLARSFNYYVWSSPGKSLPFFETVIRSTHYQKLERAISGLKKVENIAWQWGYENGLVYNTSSLNINPAADLDQVPFWRYPLTSKIRKQPVFVTYSEKNRRKDLIFQDNDNYLIDLDKNGIERWKVKLEGPIMGDIKTIDYFKNGEFQLLFNSTSAIHLINKNGIEIRNYPIRLKSAATNEISVFDYDRKKDYRYLIACRDRKVYNFDKYGKATQGWQIKVTTNIIEFPVRYFKVGSKDYLVLFDRSHTYILDRQGKERTKMKGEFVHSKNNISLVSRKGMPSYLITTDENGIVRSIGFDGKVSRMTDDNFSSNHFFLPVDFYGEGVIDFLILDKQTLSLYDISGKRIFSRSVQGQFDQAPRLTIIGNEKMIELCSSIDNRTILVRKDGSIFDVNLPDKCILQVIGSFSDKTEVSDVLAVSADGYLSNFQMVIK